MNAIESNTLESKLQPKTQNAVIGGAIFIEEGLRLLRQQDLAVLGHEDALLLQEIAEGIDRYLHSLNRLAAERQRAINRDELEAA